MSRGYLEIQVIYQHHSNKILKIFFMVDPETRPTTPSKHDGHVIMKDLFIMTAPQDVFLTDKIRDHTKNKIDL
ncbi:MAG: hypothetical protein COA48_07890 [Cycloclasticus sp.]|nr:MAG: hypothetical protein COA48_07890 [Cycloclasticus sp.]